MRYRWTKRPDGKLVKSAQIWTAGEHGINRADVDPMAAMICERLNNAGYETYLVGGAVRDLLLKKKPKDFDIASAASPTRIKKIFGNSRIIGKRFRLVHIFFGDKIFEAATFRSAKEGSTGNTFGRIEEDVMRRDFTMNALFYDPRKETIIDFVGGLKDIKDERIVPLISLKTIFEEDPVRMVRAVKYAALTGFQLPFVLRRKIKSGAALLQQISASRLTEEIRKIIVSSEVDVIVKELEVLGLYMYLQPQASRLIKTSCDFKNRYYSALQKLAAENGKAHEAAAKSLVTGLAALVRDYVDDTTDWKEAGEDSYKSVFSTARQFVLPMNPPRLELGKAVRDLFAAHGITVQNWRQFHR